MNRDELLRLLDLTGKDATAASDALEVTSVSKPAETPASPTALSLDPWGLRRGADLLAESRRLQQSGLDELAVADFHGMAFEAEPVLLSDCQDARRLEFLRQLQQTPDYRALHAVTRLDPLAAGIAATALAEQFAGLPPPPPSEKESSSSADSLQEEMNLLRGVGQALSEATREVEQCRESAAALGLGPGAPGSNDPQVIAALFRRVRSSPTLRRICELAGRYRRLAQSCQRRKVVHGLDEMVGVTLGGDLERLLAGELARLADDDLGDDLLRRLVERQLMCREHRASEPVGKGPICVVVDESGSMSGERVHTAKALALALAWIARQQRRWCALVAYSGNSGERLLALPPGRWDEVRLMDWLEAFIGRGSTLDLPLRELPGYFRQLNCPAGVTDLLAVTDAQLRIPPEVLQSFLSWKQSQSVRLISLVIRSEPGDLLAVSDEVHRVDSLAVESDAVERVLSL